MITFDERDQLQCSDTAAPLRGYGASAGAQGRNGRECHDRAKELGHRAQLGGHQTDVRSDL